MTGEGQRKRKTKESLWITSLGKLKEQKEDKEPGELMKQRFKATKRKCMCVCCCRVTICLHYVTMGTEERLRQVRTESTEGNSEGRRKVQDEDISLMDA